MQIMSWTLTSAPDTEEVFDVPAVEHVKELKMEDVR